MSWGIFTEPRLCGLTQVYRGLQSLILFDTLNKIESFLKPTPNCQDLRLLHGAYQRSWHKALPAYSPQVLQYLKDGVKFMSFCSVLFCFLFLGKFRSVKSSLTCLLNKCSNIGNTSSCFKWPNLLKCSQQPNPEIKGYSRCQGHTAWPLNEH